jgi:histidine ammonia-lyase
VKTTDTQSQLLLIDGNGLSLEDVESVARLGRPVALSAKANQQLLASRSMVEKILKEKQVVYGVTTGFGKFKDVNILPADTIKLQRNFLLSHAVGVGAPFSTDVVRAIMLLRANALSKGYSGIRSEVVELLVALLNSCIHPIVPEQGSVGASGDLAPLAHLALVLIGEGEAEVDGQILSGLSALSKRRLNPVTLLAKEGLALTNGTQAMSALATLTILEAERLAKLADIIGAMSLEALLGSEKAFSHLVQNVRPHPGQIASANNLRSLLQNSSLMQSHADCTMVQDAYSLRCIPQVHGASRQSFAHARSVLEIEINAATDNPLIFADQVISAGNFHGQPIALVMDYVAVALAELGNISERRTERLVNPQLSNGLPAFLTENGGLNSGFMMLQYTAAALVSENKCLAHPASVDSIPTSANQEDHVSMGTISCRKARSILDNLTRILSIELLSATQAIDLRTRICHQSSSGSKSTFEPGVGVKAAYDRVRKTIEYLREDRELHKDIARAEKLIREGAITQAVESVSGKLE